MAGNGFTDKGVRIQPVATYNPVTGEYVEGGGSISAVATAAAPTYAEGESEPLSMDLAGNLRIGGVISAETATTATAAAPSYIEGTPDNPLSVNLTGDMRTIAKQSGAWTVAATQSGTWNIGSITTLPALPAGTNNIGDVDVATLPALVAGSAIIGKVGLSSGGNDVDLADPTTGTPTQVPSSASAVTILAANTARKGATIFNDSTQVLYLILSNTTPTSAVYTVKMVAASYYEVPAGYNGIIKGIWASANGNAVVTELT